MTRIRIGVVKL